MNIINLIENANAKFPTRIAYEFNENKITFNEVYEKTLSIASYISSYSEQNSPIIVISNKNIYIPSTYLAIAHSNCYYVPVSSEMPKVKIEKILEITNAKLIITDEDNYNSVCNLNFNGKVCKVNDIIHTSIKYSLINQRKDQILDKNPLYVIFTSGSTGTPKGVVTSHLSVIDYVTTFIQTFNISQDEIFGNQAPLDYIAGIRDIYIPLITGCKTIFISKNLFSTPKLLFEYINKNKITTICWVSAALSLCCNLNVFDEIKPEYINKVFFTGSVLDYKCLNKWKAELPNALFVNHYGPTEITASCTYYIVENNKEYTKPAPIGIPFKNRKILIFTEDNKLAQNGEVGEICVAGNCLALGYYKNPEKTSELFIQNPVNNIYPELIYRTGDLGYIDKDNNIVFCGRKDNQIKHMGHRVELGEIEDNANVLNTVNETCCLYNESKSVITLFYSGSATASELAKHLRQNLPSYMIPRKLVNLIELPKLHNGKIDRQNLKQQMETL